MICWGDPSACGVFYDLRDEDKCHCRRNTCIRDTEDWEPPVSESDLHLVLNNLDMKSMENIHELRQMLAIKSISKDAVMISQRKQIIERLAQRFVDMEFKVEVVELPSYCTFEEDKQYAILADYFSTPNQKEVLIYGTVDVLSIGPNEKWDYKPFKLSEDKEKLYGRGVATTKGSLLCWIQAIEAWLDEMDDLPVNVRFLIETTSYSVPLHELIKRHSTFFKPVDTIIFCTNFWIGEKMPLITNAHSGYVYFTLQVEAKSQEEQPEKPEHTQCKTEAQSKAPEREPFAELCMLMSTLLNARNEVRVPNFKRHVRPVTQNDWNIFADWEVGMIDHKDRLNLTRMPHDKSRFDYLMHRWCMPSLSIHGVRFTNPHSFKQFHIPRRVKANFSVKLMPQQSVEYVIFLVKDYLNEMHRRLSCVHTVDLYVQDMLTPSYDNRKSEEGEAVEKAFQRIYQCGSVHGDSITLCLPKLNELRKLCMPDVCCLTIPFSSIRTRADQANEFITKKTYLQNRLLFASLIYELAQIRPDCKCNVIDDFCYLDGSGKKFNIMHLWERHKYVAVSEVQELDKQDVDHIEPEPKRKSALPSSRSVLTSNLDGGTFKH